MILHIFNLCQIPKGYRRFYLKPLYFLFLFYNCFSFAEDEKKYWDANLSMGFGNVRYMDGFQTNILHSQISLLIKPIESENDFEFKFSIMTQSPLREEDGFVGVPLQDYDFAQISEIWLRYQIFKNLEFKMGSFADTYDETTPVNWPFYSLYSKIDFLKEDFLNVHFIVRQDLFSTYSSQLNSPASTNVERTRVELDVSSKLESEKKKYEIKIKSVYDQYSDPDSALSSLSIGRDEYINTTVTYHDQQYRIVDLGGEFSFTYNNFIKSKLSSKYWQNLSASNYKNGYIVGLEESIHYDDTDFSVAYWKFFAAQSSIPPAALSSYYYPGFQISSLHLSLSQKICDSWKGIMEYRYENAVPYGQSPDPNSSPGTVPVIPQYKIYFILEYAFDAS
jgi:hypothetical protein